MGMPASRPRKAKPVEMRRTLRLWTVFDHSHAIMATTMATTTICQNSPENCLSFSEICIRRDGGEAGVSVVTAQASFVWNVGGEDEVFHMLQTSAICETNVS